MFSLKPSAKQQQQQQQQQNKKNTGQWLPRKNKPVCEKSAIFKQNNNDNNKTPKRHLA